MGVRALRGGRVPPRATPGEVEGSVAQLAARGVAYVTLAHLFFRQVATNAPAIPFIPDWIYRRCSASAATRASRAGRGGRASAAGQRVLIDLSHVSQAGTDGHPRAARPSGPPASGAGALVAWRLPLREPGVQPSPTTCQADRRARRRDRPDLRQPPDPRGRRRAKCRNPLRLGEGAHQHIDRIRELTGSHRHVGIGSDLDGFIKPTLAGLQTMSDMAPLEAALSRTTDRRPRASSASTTRCARCVPTGAQRRDSQARARGAGPGARRRRGAGIGHVGVLSVLDDRGYLFKRLAGTSAGSIVAALLAAGMPVGRMRELVGELDYLGFRDRSMRDRLPLIGPLASVLFENGFYEGDHLHAWLGESWRSSTCTPSATCGSRTPEAPFPKDQSYRLVVMAADLTPASWSAFPGTTPLRPRSRQAIGGGRRAGLDVDPLLLRAEEAGGPDGEAPAGGRRRALELSARGVRPHRLGAPRAGPRSG